MSQSSNELDPLFLKAIALLRSKHPDSTKQLKELVDDYRMKTYGVSLLKAPKKEEVEKIQVKTEVQETIKLEKNITTSVIKSNSNSPSPVQIEEMVEQVSYFVEETSNTGSITSNIEEIEEVSLGSSFEPKAKKSKIISNDGNSGMSPYSDNDPNDSIPIDDIIEMDFDGPSCTVCQMNRRIEVENKLVECSECHLHYHQKCHKPPISTKELNDPRMLWYCSKCTKKMKSEMAAQQSANANSKPPIDSSIQQTTNTQPKTNPFQQSKLFRRNIVATDTLKPVNISPTIHLERISSPGRPSSREGSPTPTKISKVRSDSQSSASAMKRLESVKKRAANKQKKNEK